MLLLLSSLETMLHTTEQGGKFTHNKETTVQGAASLAGCLFNGGWGRNNMH